MGKGPTRRIIKPIAEHLMSSLHFADYFISEKTGNLILTRKEELASEMILLSL